MTSHPSAQPSSSSSSPATSSSPTLPPPPPLPSFRGNRLLRVFREFDVDGDDRLNLDELTAFISHFCSLPSNPSEFQTSAARIAASTHPQLSESYSKFSVGVNEASAFLLKRMDGDKDGKVTFAEFSEAFGEPNGSASAATTTSPSLPPRPTLQLQWPLPPPPKSRVKRPALWEFRCAVESVFEGGRKRYPPDLIEDTQIPTGKIDFQTFRRFISSVLSAEKSLASREGREPSDWYMKITKDQNVSTAGEKFFLSFDHNKEGRVDFHWMFENAKMRPPASHPKKGEAESTQGGVAVESIRTVRKEFIVAFVNDLIFSEMRELKQRRKREREEEGIGEANGVEGGAEEDDVKCIPTLPHWGDDDAASKSLSPSHPTGGWGVTLLLSERTRVCNIVKSKSPTPSVSIFHTFRTECTRCSRVEVIWASLLRLSEDERFESAVFTEKKIIIDGRVAKSKSAKDIEKEIEGWGKWGDTLESHEGTIPIRI